MLHYFRDYATREGIILPPGLQSKPIKWLLIFSPQGPFVDAYDLSGGQKKSKGREFPQVPQAPNNWLLGGGRSHFLVESLATIVNWPDDEENRDKIKAKHDFFVDLLRQVAQAKPPLQPIPQLESIANALDDPGTLLAIHTRLAALKAKPTEVATVALQTNTGSPRIFVEESTWHAWWMDFLSKIKQPQVQATPRRATRRKGAELMCDLLTGELVTPQPTHDKIKGLADIGGLATGDVLAGFDKDAFTSFGLEQSANAAMSEENMKVYVTAFNHLIAKRCRRIASPKQGTGVKVGYWYSGSIPEELDPALDILGDLAETSPQKAKSKQRASSLEITQAESRAAKALDAIRSGEHPELANVQYYAITLSANSGRVIVRDWMEGNFRELVDNVNAWFDDLTVISRDGAHLIRAFKFADILGATVRDLSDVQAPVAAALWRCALKQMPIPYEVMAQTLGRVHIDIVQDEPFRHSRFALLKAFTIRCERVPSMTAELNEHETHPAYLCGRIMALLGAIQREALGDVGAGVIQRYYAAASATPALVLGRLIRTAQIAHLPKIQQEGLRCWFENQLAELWNKMSSAPPRTLTLEEQTLFAMGYYHQLAERFKKNQKQDQESDPTSKAPELPLG